MNNPKILKKVLVVALTLAMVVGAFSMFTIGTSAELTYTGVGSTFASSPVADLISEQGINFDDYTGAWGYDNGTATQVDPTRAYLRDRAGMLLTEDKSTTHRTARLQLEEDGNIALRLFGSATFINGNVNDAVNATKLAQNSMLLDLFNNPDGPKQFSLSFDMKVVGESGTTNCIAGTSDNGSTALTTKYRGVSGVTFNGTWLFKITAPNLPAIISQTDITVAGGAAKKVELADSVAENMIDKGYIYPNAGTIAIGVAAETDDIVVGGYATKPSSKTWAETQRSGTCISQEMMDMDGEGDALTYTINEYFNVRFDVTRNDACTQVTIKTYIEDQLLGTTTHNVNAASGNGSNWAYGIRLFDQTSSVLLDNLKVTAPNNDFGDIHSGAWRNVRKEIVSLPGGAGVVAKEICNYCGETLTVENPNVVYTGPETVAVDSSGTNAESVPGNPGTANRVYHMDISSVWSEVKTAPFWINFEIRDLTKVLGSATNGKSMVTWRINGENYTQIFRLFADGEIRLINPNGQFSPVDSTFRLKGTEAEPGNYKFHVYVDPTLGRYDIYVDDLSDTKPMFYYGSEYNYNLSNAATMASGYPKVRFNDETVGAYRVNNFTITQGVAAADHEHSDILATDADKSVAVGYDTLGAAYRCYCGESQAIGGGVTEVLAVCDNVYYGNGTVAGIPTEGEFWIATDYNIRTAEAVQDVNKVLELGSYAVSLEVANAPMTAQVALKVTYPEGSETANVEYYLNGVLMQSDTGVTLSDTLLLGDQAADTTDVRFNLTKVVKIGEGTTVPVTYIDSVDPDIVPCYHNKEDIKFIVDATGTLRVAFTCTKCGELVYDPSTKELHDEAASGVTFENGAFTHWSNKFYNYNLPAEVKGADKAPYQISFKVTLDSMITDLNGINNGGGGRNFMNFSSSYNSALRVFPADNGSGGYLTDVAELRVKQGDNPLVARIKLGESINISLLANPKKGTTDIYVDGVYMATSTANNPATAATMRFGDGVNHTWTVSDFSILVAADSHVHTGKWADDSTKTVFMTDKTLKYGYECYCGEIAYDQDITAVHAETKNVYYGNASIENIPTEGNFWILTDYNVRTEEALATADNIFVLGNYAVTINENVKAKSTTQYAVNVVYTAEGVANVYLYVDGELTEALKDVEMGEATTLKLGNDGAATTDIRFNNTRVISVGDTDEPVALTFVDGVDASVRPCFHETVSKFVPVAGETYNGLVKAINKLVKISDCSKCGERLYAEQGDVIGIYENFGFALDETGSTPARVPGATALAVKREDVSIGSAEPYWMSFDISATFTEAQTTAVKNKGTNGASILAFRVPWIEHTSAGSDMWDGSGDDYAYLHLMRAYSVDRTDAIGINFYQGGGSNPKFIMESGKSYHVAIRFDPSEDGYSWKAYLDGVLIEERVDPVTSTFYSCIQYDRADVDIVEAKNAELQRMFQFRFTDNNYGDIYIKNFALVKEGEAEAAHVHSGAWLNEEEKAASTFTVYDDNTVAYSYQCYCGEIVSEGISEILADGVVPAYNSTTPTTVVADGVIAHDSIFMGSAMAKELPAEGIKALISIGGQSIVSVDAEGVVYLGEAATDLTIAADEWCDFAIRSAYEGYIVYFGGEYLGVVAYEDVDTLEVTVGSEGMGKFHFDKMAVVLLSIDGDSAIEVGTDGHAHQFDPTTAELIFDESRTAITVEYVCTICDRPAVDGIVKNLYDDETTDETEAIYAVIGTPIGGVTVIDDAFAYVEGTSNFWFSADFTVTTMPNKNRQNVVSFMGTKLVLIDADGSIRVGSESTVVVGSVKKGEMFNVTFNVVDDPDATVHVYVNGIYCATYTYTGGWGILDVAVGDGDPTLVMDVTNIKLAELGNDGMLHIGAYVCEYHSYDYSKAVINYLDLETFVVTNECLFCGHTVTERPVWNYYGEAIAPIFNHGGITAAGNDGEWVELPTSSYWLVADVNKRVNDLGAFSGYVNLIGEYGDSYVLINSAGDLMLGNGIKVGNYFGLTTGVTTHNIAVQSVHDVYNVYVDGKFVGSFGYDEIKYTYEHTVDSYEKFGAEGLENVMFYNIKTFDACPEGTPVTFEYAEAEGIIPCPHVYDSNTMTKTAVFGEKIQLVYICKDCGERIHLTYTEDQYDESLNTSFVFDENGEFVLTNTTTLKSSVDVLGSKASPFWVKFTVKVEDVDPEAVGANNNNNNGGRNFMNFMPTYASPLRLFADKDYSTGKYYEDHLILRANSLASGTELTRLYEGESYDLALYVDPAEAFVEIYVDGKYAASRSGAIAATCSEIRFLDGKWGTFVISDFELVSGDSFEHFHTAAYSAELGMVPTLVYGDQTLKHTFICTCGETIVEGIDTAIAEEIMDLEGVVEATAIPETAGKTVNAPYWVSAKVYGDGTAATVYSYNDEEIVGIADGVYTIAGAATEVAVSGKATAGDYDVVSICVDPITDTVLVYVNGVQIGACNSIDFAASEEFNVLLGGGATLGFKFVKVVTLAEGVDNKVNIYGCGDHAFGYRSGIIAEVTSTGVVYKCKFCDEKKVVRTLTIGDAPIYTKNDGTINISSNANYVEGEGIYDDVLAPEDGGNFIISFNIKPTDLSGLADGGKSLVCWLQGSTGYRWFFRAFKLDANSAEMKLYNGVDYVSASTPIIFEKNVDYSVIIEVDPATGNYYVYVNGNYMGGSTMGIRGGATVQYRLRFGDSGTGKWTVTNLKMYNPQTDKIEAVTSSNEDVVIAHSHFPDTSKEHSITVENGVITQKFTCTCGKEVELDVMTDLSEDIKTEYKDITSYTKLPAGDALKSNTATYVLSYDFTVNAVNVPKIVSGSLNNGRSLVGVVGGSDMIHLLRAFGHPYKDGEGYKDNNGDGYADNVIDVRSTTGRTGKLIKTMGVGDTVNVTYVIDPVNAKMVIYVDGEMFTTRNGFAKLTSESTHIRLLDNTWGSFDFTNFRLVRMSDECTHEAPACSEGVHSGACTLCGMSVEVTHNYTATSDMTNKWTKYTCADCGNYYIVFNNMSVVADLTFASKSELMKYLTETYCPVFR